MIEVQIQRWIAENGSFVAGMQLLQLADDGAYRQLSRYLGASIITPAIKNELKTALEKSISAVSISQKQVDEPEEIKKLRKEARGYHKQYADLKARLRLMYDKADIYTDEDRMQIAEEILEQVLPPTDAIYERIRTWESTGELPIQSMQQVVAETVAKYKQTLSLIPRISRLQKWLKDGERPTRKGVEIITPTIRIEIENELAEKQQQLQLLHQELGLDA